MIPIIGASRMSTSELTHHEVASRGGKARAALRTPAERSAEMSARAKARHSLDSYIKSIAARAPELTAEQLDKLRAIVRSAGAK